jgi:hypothetical protein
MDRSSQQKSERKWECCRRRIHGKLMYVHGDGGRKKERKKERKEKKRKEKGEHKKMYYF